MLTITLPQESCNALICAVHAFVYDAPGCKQPLRQWQRLLGWINWGLNVQPLLRPALSSSYDKMCRKLHATRPMYINKSVKDDLLWVADMFDHHGGVHLLRSHAWCPHNADLEVLCDACLTGLGFWSSARQLDFMASLPSAPD